MSIKHCTLCERKVSAQRQIGVGTLILVFVTAGLWLIAIPFYEERCPICRATAFDADDSNYRGERGQKIGFWLGRKLRTAVKH